jgi:hypothetical protein
MIEPKLELKKVKNQLNRLDLVKKRAEMRTKRRIAEQLEKQELEALEQNLAPEPVAEVEPVETKKGN